MVRTLPCHGRGRGFESRRPRHSFQALARNWQFASWSNLVQLGLFPPGLSTRRTGLLRASLLFGLRKKIQRNATVGMTWELLYHIHFLFLVVLTQQSCVGVNVDGLPLYTLTRICSAEYTKRVESVFEIIAEPNRRAILSLLVSSQRSVGEIERQLRMPQPTVSKHLRVLREAGFVESTVDAQRRLYRLKPEPLQELNVWLAQFRRFWSAHVDALERHLDRIDQDRMDQRPYGSATLTKRKTKEKTTRPKPRT